MMYISIFVFLTLYPLINGFILMRSDPKSRWFHGREDAMKVGGGRFHGAALISVGVVIFVVFLSSLIFESPSGGGGIEQEQPGRVTQYTIILDD